MVENTNALTRKYLAAQFQYSYRFPFNVFTGGGYTWSRLTGNFEGENLGSGPITASFDFPEFISYPQFRPTGYLSADQRHRARAWVGYDFAASFGNISVTALERFDSGRPYGTVSTIATVLNPNTNPPTYYVPNPGYAVPPGNSTYYFTSRHAFRTDNITETDLALSLNVKVFKYVELFVRPELLNVFNEKGFTGGRIGTDSNTSVFTADNQASYAPFNPYTTTPVPCPQRSTTNSNRCAVPGSNYQLGPSFGQAVAAAAYQLPRTFRFSVGIRF